MMKVTKAVIRTLLIALVVLVSVPIVVVEWKHYKTYGHFVSYGLHVDVLNRDVSIGIPGRTKEYWAQLTNFSLRPVQLTMCRTRGDTIMPPLQSGWAVQRYDDRTKSWQTIIDATQGGFCRSLLSTDVETKYLEP